MKHMANTTFDNKTFGWNANSWLTQHFENITFYINNISWLIQHLFLTRFDTSDTICVQQSSWPTKYFSQNIWLSFLLDTFLCHNVQQTQDLAETTFGLNNIWLKQHLVETTFGWNNIGLKQHLAETTFSQHSILPEKRSVGQHNKKPKQYLADRSFAWLHIQ